MHLKKLAYFSFALLFLSLLANGWLISSRHRFEDGRLVDLSSLYTPKDQPHVSHLHLHNNQLELQLQGLPFSQLLTQPLEEGTHFYSIEKPLSFHFTASLTPNGVELTQCSLPLLPSAQWERSMWQEGLFKGEPCEVIQASSQLLKEGISIKEEDNSRQKILKIGHFLCQHIQGKKGPPKPKVEQLPGLSTFWEMEEKGERVWCSNIAKMYCSFANLAGVPTREVHTIGRRQGVHLTGHALAESYLKEERKWAVVDLSHERLLITNQEDQPIHLAQLWQGIQGSSQGLFTYLSRGKKIEKVPYSTCMEEDRYYLGPSITLAYHPPRSYPRSSWSQLKDFYLSPKLLFTPNPHPILQRQFLRITCFWSLLCTSFLSLFTLLFPLGVYCRERLSKIPRCVLQEKGGNWQKLDHPHLQDS